MSVTRWSPVSPLLIRCHVWTSVSQESTNNLLQNVTSHTIDEKKQKSCFQLYLQNTKRYVMSPVFSTHESLTVELQVNERDNDGVVTTVNDNS
jgi:hypothetical protein